MTSTLLSCSDISSTTLLSSNDKGKGRIGTYLLLYTASQSVRGEYYAPIGSERRCASCTCNVSSQTMVARASLIPYQRVIVVTRNLNITPEGPQRALEPRRPVYLKSVSPRLGI